MTGIGAVTGISAMDVWLPPETLAVPRLPELETHPATHRQAVAAFGIETVRDAAGRSATDLAVESVKRLVARDDVDASGIGALLVVGSRAPEYLMSSESTRITREAGLDVGLSFSVSDLGCVSISAALLTASALLSATPDWSSVLIAHGCVPPGPSRLRYPVTVNGDAGLALLVRREERMRVLDVAVETDGSFWDLFRVDYRDVPSQQWHEECTDLQRYSFELALQSRTRLRKLNELVLARQGRTFADVDHVVMQNLSVGAFRFYEETFDVEIARACYDNLRAFGHLGSIDIVANLASGVRSGEFAEGDLVLVMNNSPAAAWSSMLVEI
ncbi:3-oxoacyl-[acyl-carrier-protein] synthase III C-terminal domain-containing protein [Streptomyces sp. NPDC050504]|uniref:3-oxoacyl-[acyl-carrier-protein] synthase III C-terminal domain-containing protein n=1 Tax=Streptomyces sp. NPDC050504 TaxID=3365618 RepID=UPI0037A3924E